MTIVTTPTSDMSGSSNETASLEKNKEKVVVSPIQSAVEAAVTGVDKRDIDEGAKFMAEHPEYSDYTEKEALAVRRKIDWNLVPLLLCISTIAAVDKICISNAYVYGMNTVVTGGQYSWVGSIFYFGYLLMEPFANVIIQRWPVGKVFKVAIVLWNVILLLMAAPNNFAGLGALRFLMGMSEAVNFPSQTILITMFYKKSEQPARCAIIFSGFSSLITGIISYGVGHGTSAIAPWRLLFLTFGCITTIVTIWGWIIIPDSPMTAWWLTEKQRYIAVDRTKENRTGTRNTVFKKYQVIEALKDYKNWLMCIVVISWNIPNGALVTFAAEIVSGMGYSAIRTTLLGMPTGVFMTVSSLLIVGLSYFTPMKNKTTWSVLIGIVPLACGLIIKNVAETDSNKTGLLVCYYFFYLYWGPYVAMIALSVANTSGHTKKTVVNMMNFVCYCIANIIAPQFFRSSQAPTYPLGYNAIIGFICAGMACMILYAVGCIYENKQRDKKYGKPQTAFNPEEDTLDLTDQEKADVFRYSW